MTPTLTAEKIGELEKMLAKATPAPWDRDTENGRREETFEMLIDSNGKVIADTANSDLQVIDYDSDEDGTRYFDETGYRNFSAIAALRNAAPALIAMAKQVITHDSPAWDANERLNDTVEELIERAEKAEAEAKRCTELEGRLKNSRSGEAIMFERAEKAEAEAARLKKHIMIAQGVLDNCPDGMTQNDLERALDEIASAVFAPEVTTLLVGKFARVWKYLHHNGPRKSEIGHPDTPGDGELTMGDG